MSPRTPRKAPPVASRRKRALHVLYLVQPVLQFVALMVVLFTLGRCSPLSPSTDKGSKLLAASSLANSHAAQAIQAAEDEDIKRELKDLRGPDELAVISQSEFAAQIEASALDADKGTDLNGVQALFRARAQQGLRRNVHLLALHLTKEQRDAFFQNAIIRINLADTLASGMNPEVRRAYFAELHRLIHGNLSAKAYLVLADEDASSPDAITSLPIIPKFQLAIFPSDNKAYLQVSRSEVALDDQQQKLIESNKDKALSLTLVLD